MTDVLPDRTADAPAASPDAGIMTLGKAPRGRVGTIVSVGGAIAGDDGKGALDSEELERRLLELGFVEGAKVEILHEGLIGRDPIAVKLDDMRVALRRLEAGAIQVRFDAR